MLRPNTSSLGVLQRSYNLSGTLKPLNIETYTSQGFEVQGRLQQHHGIPTAANWASVMNSVRFPNCGHNCRGATVSPGSLKTPDVGTSFFRVTDLYPRVLGCRKDLCTTLRVAIWNVANQMHMPVVVNWAGGVASGAVDTYIQVLWLLMALLGKSHFPLTCYELVFDQLSVDCALQSECTQLGSCDYTWSLRVPLRFRKSHTKAIISSV